MNALANSDVGVRRLVLTWCLITSWLLLLLVVVKNEVWWVVDENVIPIATVAVEIM